MKVAGIVLIVAALVVGIVPMFSDCQSQGKAIELANGKLIPMKCHWTGRAELALGVPLLAVGGMVIGSRRKATLQALSITGAILGLGAIALPTFLIGVCGTAGMSCNTVMSPTLIFAGVLTVAAGVVGIVLARRAEG
jgi:Domain of unknown function (DUF4418)